MQRSGARHVLGAHQDAVRHCLRPQPAPRLLHVLLCHLGEGVVLRRQVVRGVHGRAGRRQGRERGAGGEGGQGLRGVVRALALVLRQVLGVEDRAFSGRALQRQQVTEVGFERLSRPFVALVLRHAVDVSEADGAEGAAAGRQGAPAGGQRAAAATGGDRQRTGRQAGDRPETALKTLSRGIFISISSVHQL